MQYTCGVNSVSNLLRSSLLVILLAGTMSACGKSDEGITVNASLDDSSNSAVTDDVAIDRKDGNLSVKIPGVSANVKLPDGLLAKSDFDIDGVKLYPGATVTSMKVNARSGDTQSSVVRIGYAAPAEAAKVRDWFAKAFADKSIAIQRQGEGLAGTTADGDKVTMSFAAAEGGKSTGTIEVVDPS